LFLCSLVRFIRSRPCTNGIIAAVYNEWMDVEVPCAPDPSKGCNSVVTIGHGMYYVVPVRTQHKCIMLSFLSFSLVCCIRLRMSVPTKGIL
jgi:hypothetical protein